jgi:hypothetical protein
VSLAKDKTWAHNYSRQNIAPTPNKPTPSHTAVASGRARPPVGFTSREKLWVKNAHNAENSHTQRAAIAGKTAARLFAVVQLAKFSRPAYGYKPECWIGGTIIPAQKRPQGKQEIQNTIVIPPPKQAGVG